MTSWLLVHPPLLGPAVLGPLAAELRSRGNAVRVPDLRDAVRTAAGWPDRCTALAAAGGPADVVLGFSGAGVVLPSVAAAVRAHRVVWLDALVPAVVGLTVTPPERLAQLAGLVRGDRFAPWPTWWPPEVLAAELPDPALRAAVAAEAPELPADFYSVAVPVPASWPDDDVRYVQLSPGYDRDAAEARARGWPVLGDGRGSHLDVAARAGGVAASITSG
ncbi:hypothetical protein FHX36_001158 [Modestobacter versicolor]|uniref:Alpha/beta hydrolase n=1 Tax=Modestobacter versicolor TaxID=429133 RepID=A0A839Y6P8_9ACTN|nr:alpha/beta hydrolase [Modestobacter versicolor]MBB3675423.1 hypothetical protein [Modestobacter versicolor]